MVASEHEVAQKAQTHMADVVSTIKAILEKVTQSVDAARKGWQGDANASFVTATSNWDGEAARLNGILNDMQDKVGQGTIHFRNMDSENESGFKTLTNLV
ncbi:WXG100 family type VII secretion target [Nocardia sp. NPDC006630]|uniref:WXG100 family type VII secretion target n=1 Tax=Nocardia sp. NPDC006630 TaxID=3157181 RepID=UPI0033AAE4F0